MENKKDNKELESPKPPERRPIFRVVFDYLLIGILTLSIFYLSLLTSSVPVSAEQRGEVDRAILLLEEKGFTREAFLLRQSVFRDNDNWLNQLTIKENAYAATNFPFGIITLYPDFYTKATDDIERAAILLHEAQHLQGKSERAAYETVWQNREKLGWTQLSHGTTESYITIQILTREYAPNLFTCHDHLWNDCTEEQLRIKN